MTALDQIAPYPRTEHEVTADALARSFAVHAQVHWRMAIDHPDRDKARESALWVGQYFSLAFLLRELKQRAGRAAADEVARNLWAEIDAVSGMGGYMWHWLDGYGISVARVNEVTDKLMALPDPREVDRLKAALERVQAVAESPVEHQCERDGRAGWVRLRDLQEALQDGAP